VHVRVHIDFLVSNRVHVSHTCYSLFEISFLLQVMLSYAAQETHEEWIGMIGVLQCVAVCCCVLHCVALCCTVLHCVALCCSVLECVAGCCRVLQCVAVRCSVLQCVAACCTACQRVALGCSMLSYVLQESH